MDVRIGVVFLVLGGTFAFKGKGFYCRDPDTGKLHAVNTTWPSSTFCGNYTCKLKIKNIPNAPPIREFKVSDINISDIKVPQVEKLPQKLLQNKTDGEKRISSILNKIMSNINVANTNAKVNESIKGDKKDRYLNDKEIKLISDMLHSVKKSDLEAVVDIYNLAQEIYKELDKKTSENLVEETVNEIKTSRIPETIQHQDQKTLITSISKQAHDKPSYWYDPVIISHKVRPLSDLNSEGSDIIPSKYPEKKYKTPQVVSSMSFSNYGKQPFFYELSDFQRLASYVRSSPPPSTQENLRKIVTENSPILQSTTVLSPHPTEKQPTQEPLLLPFPYYQVHYHTYNATGYPYQYYTGMNPYHDDYRKEYKKHYASPVPSIQQEKVPEKPYKSESLLEALLPKNDSKNKTPDWKTDSLAADVIEDIRGNIEKSILFKPLCLRKKVKLEKVGKVYKLEDVLRREKRSTSKDEIKDEMDDDRYEVYIERTTCLSDVNPGFFRMGNETAPYPACCPQRITR